jgi:hypothetical protein
MKLITYGESSWLLGDEAADSLIAYAVLLAQHETADSIVIKAIDQAGAQRDVTFLIGPATMMTGESTTSALTEPDNAAALSMIADRTASINTPRRAVAGTVDEGGGYLDEF